MSAIFSFVCNLAVSKNSVIYTLDKVIYFKRTIFQGSTKPLFTSQNRMEPPCTYVPLLQLSTCDGDTRTECHCAADTCNGFIGAGPVKEKVTGTDSINIAP
jgi:hypothetical protein